MIRLLYAGSLCCPLDDQWGEAGQDGLALVLAHQLGNQLSDTFSRDEKVLSKMTNRYCMRQSLRDRHTSVWVRTQGMPWGSSDLGFAIGSHRPTSREDSSRAFEDNAPLPSSCLANCNGDLPFLG